MQISIFGTGYVGLVTGLCLAEIGHDVLCLDVNPSKVQSLQKGQSPIFEQGLEDLLKRNLQKERIRFSTQLVLALESAQLIFIALGTPSDSEGRVDLTEIKRLIQLIGQNIKRELTIVVKSTVPVGTAKILRQILDDELSNRGLSISVPVITNPEFLREGSALQDFLKPARVLIGADNKEEAAILEELYEPFVKNGHPLLIMDSASAELAKYAANAFLATKISFMNELTSLCEKTGADIEDIRHALGHDARIGSEFLYAGIGFGGSCLPKDLRALQQIARDHDEHLPVIQAAEQTNHRQKARILNKAKQLLSATPSPQVAIWGLAFKPGTDDLRESPALELIHGLLKENIRVQAYDPVAGEKAREHFANSPGVEVFSNQYDALNDCDLLVIATEWQEFREPHFQRMQSCMRQARILDARNIYNPNRVRNRGFDYVSIGRPL
ncbi:UDP-glucose dehydrogenase family protein [Bdellovibrio sp. HCB2-146]|uniref:UDP-glucose dehydrogenase family protein n=1 Tax=Bdellovibrio sp. HCB2-146 TaxID=3394362 RepID=UPI0039BD8B0C